MSTAIRTRAPRLAALLAVVAAGCGPAGPPTSSEGPELVATVFPVADLLARVAGPEVSVATLLPPRASPATWEATPGQIRALGGARGVVSVGAGLDGWVDGLVPGDGVRVLRLTDGMDLLHGGHDHGPGAGADDGGDPHVWLDPLLVRDEILPRLTAFVGALYPDSAVAVARRASALADSLTALDGEIRATLAEAGGRDFVSTHDAWGYFARAYGLESAGSVYERPGHEPSARGLAALVRRARDAGIPSVLTEPQLAATAARALADELGAGVVVVDPLGGPGLEGRDGYLELMRFNARAFREGLGGGIPPATGTGGPTEEDGHGR